MKLIADECCPLYLVDALRNAAHDVIFMAEFSPSTPDDDILTLSLQENRIIITEDHDFGDLIFRDGHDCLGVMLIRIPHDTPEADRSHRIINILSQYETQLMHHFATVTLSNIRLRPI